MDDKYLSIFKNAPRLITLVYEDGMLKDCNDRMFDFLGYTKKEVIGKHVKMFFGEFDSSRIKENMAQIMLGKKQDEEYDMIRKDGDIINVTIKSVMTIDEEGRKHTICFIADITKQKEIQKRLRESLLELRKSNEELEEFAYVASHDLQEPLRVVASYCQLLQEDYYDILDDDGKTYVDYAVESAVRMKTLIKELLDFSRVGRRDKPYEYVSIKEIIEESIIDYQMAINDHNAKIIVEDEMPVVFAIRFRIKQLIANIISNALKFKSDKSPVINIYCCDEGSFWLFCVKDNGIGIESQFFDRIFGIFKRLYSRDEYPGTGIGLALCKKIVETHGGKIWVDSEENKGTHIYFTIPKHIEVTEVIDL